MSQQNLKLTCVKNEFVLMLIAVTSEPCHLRDVLVSTVVCWCCAFGQSKSDIFLHEPLLAPVLFCSVGYYHFILKHVILPPVQDTVIGKIYFLLVRIKLKHMEIEIRRRETIGSGSNARNESETLAKYEIMDGAPVRGENIPIRWASMGSSAPCHRALEDGTTIARGDMGPTGCSVAAVPCAQCRQEQEREHQICDSTQREMYGRVGQPELCPALRCTWSSCG